MEIARALSKYIKIPIDFKSLSRVRATLPQTRITFEERQVNVKNAFRFKNLKQYKHVAVVDDVATTLSTLNEIARTLKKEGVEVVDNWCIAKA